MNLTRRKTLLASGAALALAGCVDGITGGDENDDSPEDIGIDVFQLGPSTGQPWWTTNEDETGFVTLLESEHDQPWMVESPAEIDGLEDWLDETNFDHSRIVYVETAAPNACYTELDISNVTVKNRAIVGEATATDTSDDNEACNEVETYPAAFVRVTGDNIPADAAFTITDGWGNPSEVTADGQYIDPEGLPGHVQPDGDPAKHESLNCDAEEFHRHPAPSGNVVLGEAHNDDELTFAMRFHGSQALAAGDEGSPQVGRGHEVRITMRNVSTDMQITGSRHRYSLQVLTMDGWQDVRGTTDDGSLGYDAIGIEHRPGEGFEWTFEMTEDGVIPDDHPHTEKLRVCPDLQPGRYRFVYHDAAGEPLAVEFNYSD